MVSACLVWFLLSALYFLKVLEPAFRMGWILLHQEGKQLRTTNSLGCTILRHLSISCFQHLLEVIESEIQKNYSRSESVILSSVELTLPVSFLTDTCQVCPLKASDNGDSVTSTEFLFQYWSLLDFFFQLSYQRFPCSKRSPVLLLLSAVNMGNRWSLFS